MPIVALTDRFCSNVKSAARVDYFDAKTSGLCLRVAPSGLKTFTFHFTTPAGKRARLSLGRYPGMALARARTLAIEAQGQAGEGADPRGQGAHTVRELVTRYTEKHGSTLRSGKAIERRLTKNVLPILGDRPIEGLHKRDLNRVLDPIITRGAAVEAARCFEDMRALFRWAVSRGDLDHSPMEGMRKPAPAAPRERVLADSELKKLWRGLPEALPRSVACQQIIKLCLLTAQRVGEVAGMTRAELDLRARTWTIPSSRSKNKHAHTVPLSDAAIAVIKEARGETFLFPDNGRGALPAHAVAHTIRLAQARLGSISGRCTIYGELPSPAWRSLAWRPSCSATSSITGASPRPASRLASMCSTATSSRRVLRSRYGLTGSPALSAAPR